MLGRLTLQGGAGVALDRAVGRGQPGAGALEIFAVFPKLLESGMGASDGRDGGKNSCGLHGVYSDASNDVVSNDGLVGQATNE